MLWVRATGMTLVLCGRMTLAVCCVSRLNIRTGPGHACMEGGTIKASDNRHGSMQCV